MRLVALLAMFCVSPGAAAAADLSFVATPGRMQVRPTAVIDTRPLVECQRASLHGARCLPAGDLLGPDGRLPRERDLLWLFGTLGLNGAENVLVIGSSSVERDFVAGLLYLAGQRTVRILDVPPARATENGQARSAIREAVWTAPMRDRLWVLGADILRDRPSLIKAGSAGAPAKAAVVVDADTMHAIAQFTRLRAGGKFDVRVHPAPWH